MNKLYINIINNNFEQNFKTLNDKLTLKYSPGTLQFNQRNILYLVYQKRLCNVKLNDHSEPMNLDEFFFLLIHGL